jgi:hypothetical protein
VDLGYIELSVEALNCVWGMLSYTTPKPKDVYATELRPICLRFDTVMSFMQGDPFEY